MSYFISFIILLLLTPAFASASKTPPLEIKAAVAEDVFTDFKKFLNGRPPESVDDFSGTYARRDVAELILLHQVLRLGGLKFTIKYIQAPSYQRALLEINKGHIDILANPCWSYDLENPEAVWSSEPTIRQGEFTAGLYGKINTINKMKGIALSDLLKKRVATAFAWKSDHQALIDAGFTNIMDGYDWPRLIRALKHDRVDLILAAFRPSKDLSFIEQEETLVPLPGYRIVLNGERVWAVSRKSPHGKKIIAALSQGLREARKRKLLLKAYTQSGFFSPQVNDWVVLGKSPQ